MTTVHVLSMFTILIIKEQFLMAFKFTNPVFDHSADIFIISSLHPRKQVHIQYMMPSSFHYNP